MHDAKTKPRSGALEAFLGAVEPERRRAEAYRLDRLFRETTGFAPVLWGPAMVGYGRYAYRYASGHAGEAMATGFSPRKAALTIYIMPGDTDFGPILARLGKHKRGKSCLYVNKLADIDLDVLAELIRAGLDDLAKHWPIAPS